MDSFPEAMSMRSFFLVLTLVAVAAPVQGASNVNFPYETTVEVDETFVRSGSSTRYYPTSKLRRGDKVIVHRHDPGGWCMIAPPPGSFSWVPARYVEKMDADRGTITTDRVAVRVGSFESDIREVFQRTLAQGDEIRIVGQKMLPPDSGNGPAELWYRVEPPRGEWRWVMGQAVAPPPRSERNPGGDPFAAQEYSHRAQRTSPPSPDRANDVAQFDSPLPNSAARGYLDDRTADAPPVANRPLVRKQGKDARRQARRRQDGILEELDRLDARFRSILDRPSLEWDFSQLEVDYEALRSETDNDNIRQMIAARLNRIAHFGKVRADEEDIARIKAETEKRDAELADVQRRQEAQLATLRQPRYDGVGIVERSALTRRGSPRYALLNQSGRVLAYLVPAPGVNLEGWVGRAAGITGSRVHHPELKSDLITVNRLTPVRIAP
jgi:hypothetical protein